MATTQNLSIGRSVGVLMVLVLVLAFTGLFGTWYAYESGAEALQQADSLSVLTDDARSAQVDFKIQVQLWKNLLLRGQDATEFQSYHQRFEAQHALVQKDLQSIEAAPTLPEDLRSEIKAIIADHVKLDAAYAAALPGYVQGDPSSIFAVDAAVRGTDQTLNLRIDKVAVALAAEQQRQLNALQSAAKERYHMLSLISLVLTSVTVVAVIVLGWRATRLPRN